ncbi:prostaglandin E2 receptor EP4 subtype-like isoform X3 [Crassostrea virginica]
MRNKTAYRTLCEITDNESEIPAYFQLIMGSLGNILAIGVLWISRTNHQWRSFYIFFTGLVLTDLLNNCTCCPLVIIRYASHFKWCLSYRLCDLMSFVEAFCHLTSGMIICIMTIDRYLHLTSVSQQSTVESRLKYTGILCVIMLISAVVSGLHLVGIGNSQLYYPGSWCFLDFTSKSLGNKINAFIYSGIGISVMASTLIIGLKTLKITCRNTEYQALLLDNSLVTGIYDNHVTAFLITSMFTFVLLWGPLLVDLFLHAAGLTTSNYRKELWLIRLMSLNTLINPWLYVILRRESVLMFFVLVLRCRRHCCLKTKEEHLNNEVKNFANPEQK